MRENTKKGVAKKCNRLRDRVCFFPFTGATLIYR